MSKRKDGRKAVLIYLTPEIARALRIAAVEADTHAYLLAEAAIVAWLAARGG